MNDVRPMTMMIPKCCHDAHARWSNPFIVARRGRSRALAVASVRAHAGRRAYTRYHPRQAPFPPIAVLLSYS
jgi:hypothetical protein